MPETQVKLIVERIERWLELKYTERIRIYLSRLHPSDSAEIIRHLDQEEANEVISILGSETAGSIISELDELTQADLIEEIESTRLAKMIQMMPPDDAADILENISEEKMDQILNSMSMNQSNKVRSLLEYDPETAGGIMTPEVIAINENMNMQQSIDYLRKQKFKERIFNLYVINDQYQLVGKIALDQLLVSESDVVLKDIMDKDLHKVTTDLDQEKVAALFEKYDLSSIPVVDSESKLVGRITVDDVIDVIQEEHTEDIYRMAGTDDAELEQSSVFRIAGVRLPWLMITICGELMASFLIKHYDIALNQILALVFFIPIILAVGGNIGIQSSTITVRGLATGKIKIGNFITVFFREFRIGVIMGIVCGIIVGLAASFIVKDHTLGYIVSFSMFLSVSVAAAFGAVLPLVLSVIKVDPALAAGPLITMSNDVIGLLVYFSVATYLLDYFGKI